MVFEYKISVVVPVYNVEKYLKTCVESILAQTQDGIELILVDDCSTDSSLSIAQDYMTRYPQQIKVIRCAENGRQGRARNIGMEIASGEYIGFLDSDDFVDSRMYERLFQKARSTGADLTCIQRAVVPDNAEDVELSECAQRDVIWNKAMTALEGKALNDQDRQLLMVNEIGGVYVCLYKRDLIERAATKFPEKTRYEDNFWMTMLFPHVKSVAFVEEIGYYYRKNPTSTVQTRNPSYYSERITMENRIQEEMDANGNTQRYYDALEYIYLYRALRNTFFLFVTKFDEIPWGFFSEIKASLKKRFPHWKKCRYLTKRMRLEVIMIYYFPQFTSCMVKLRNKIR